MQPSAAGAQRLAERNEGFSFAYLKELMLSLTMRWMAARQPGAMDTLADVQGEMLRCQLGA